MHELYLFIYVSPFGAWQAKRRNLNKNAHTTPYLCTCKLSLLYAVFALNHDKHASENEL